jgi:hypothetical protein
MQAGLHRSPFPVRTTDSGYRIIGGVGDFRGVMVRDGVGFWVGLSVLRQFACASSLEE